MEILRVRIPHTHGFGSGSPDDRGEQNATRLGHSSCGPHDSQTSDAGATPNVGTWAAIEPTIGHLRSDNGLNRNYLTGREGDKINALLSAAGYNLRKLLRWVVFAPIFRLWWWLKAFLSAKPARCRQDLSPAPP